MILSKACSYGLRAVIYLARNGGPGYVPIRELAHEVGLSFHFLTKILQSMTAARLLESHKGPRGGVALARSADDISVYDVIVAIDGDGVFSQCILGLPDCGAGKPCPLHDQWALHRSRLEEMMRDETIAGLARDAGRLSPTFGVD